MIASRRSLAGRLFRGAVVGLHALILSVAVAVPVYAICDAALALLTRTGGDDFAEFARLDRWIPLLRNTAVVCGLAVLGAALLGGLLSFLVTRTNLPGRRLLFAAALLGACIPIHVSAVIFFPHLPLSRWRGSAVICGLLYALVYAPLAGLVLGAAFRSTDRELEDEARLNAGPWGLVRRAILPQVAWGLAAVGLIVGLLVATDFTIPDLLIVRTFAEETYSQYQLAARSAGPVLTSLPVLFVLTATLLVVAARLRWTGEHSPWATSAPLCRFELGRWRFMAGLLTAVILICGAALPLAYLLYEALPFGDIGRRVSGLRAELRNSTLLALVGASVVLIPATGLAWVLIRGQRDVRWAVAVAIIVLLALPAPVAGISLIGLLNRPGILGWLYDRPTIVVLGYLVRLLPIATLLLVPAVQRVPRELEDAARVDGADWVSQQWYVRWPALRADAAVVWLVLLTLCFGELGASMLVTPAGWPLASVHAYQWIHNGIYRDLALLTLLSIGCILIPWSALLLLLSFRAERSAVRNLVGVV